MNLTPIEWKTPQVCRDCKEDAAEGWQEVKRSPGGHYLEKRCNPCGIIHYGKAVLDQLGAPTKKKMAGHKAGDTEMTEAPLLD